VRHVCLGGKPDCSGRFQPRSVHRPTRGLADRPEGKKLEALYLGLSKVSDDGLKQLTTLKNLRILHLVDLPISDAGIKELAALNGLQDLAINGTQVTDAGLATIKNLADLMSLNVRQTKVTVKALTDLHAARPRCKIHHDGGIIEPRAALAPDRQAAEWVLSIGGVVRVDGQDRDIMAVADLPGGPFRLTSVVCTTNPKVSDAGLAHFKDCKDLTQLHLGSTQVSDAGLAYFKDCKSLTQLYLWDTKVSDAGLAYFKDCKSLTHLHLGGTQVSDAGLAQLKDCKRLTYLDVRKTKMTAKALAEFQAAVPGCKIEHDGGVVEATKGASAP
jgi:Leucine-rich repeat (LRR) protein